MKTLESLGFFFKLCIIKLSCPLSTWRNHSTSSEARETVWANRDFDFYISYLFNPPSLWPVSLFSGVEKTGGGCCSWLVKLLGSHSFSELFPLRRFYIYIHICIFISIEVVSHATWLVLEGKAAVRRHGAEALVVCLLALVCPKDQRCANICQSCQQDFVWDPVKWGLPSFPRGQESNPLFFFFSALYFIYWWTRTFLSRFLSNSTL